MTSWLALRKVCVDALVGMLMQLLLRPYANEGRASLLIWKKGRLNALATAGDDVRDAIED
jgi:hypothetical protein